MKQQQPSDRFPTAAILVPPVGSLFCVLALRLIVGSGSLQADGLAALPILGIVAFLWLGVFVELIALPLGAMRLWRGQATTTVLRLVILIVGLLYLAAFIIWLTK